MCVKFSKVSRTSTSEQTCSSFSATKVGLFQVRHLPSRPLTKPPQTAFAAYLGAGIFTTTSPAGVASKVVQGRSRGLPDAAIVAGGGTLATFNTIGCAMDNFQHVRFVSLQHGIDSHPGQPAVPGEAPGKL